MFFTCLIFFASLYISSGEDLVTYKLEKNITLKIKIGDPNVIAIAPKKVGWGYYQFPSLGRWNDGTLTLTYNIAPDAAESYGQPRAALVSHDGGRTWQSLTGKWGAGGLLLPNGDQISIATPKPYNLTDLNLPKPVGELTSSYGKQKYVMYRLSDLPRKLRTIRISRVSKGAGFAQIEHAWLDDPFALRYSIRSIFPIVWWGNLNLLKDGSILAVVYPGNMLREDGSVDPHWHVFSYRSTDFGRTWKIQGRILYQPDLKADPVGNQRDGFSEPTSIVLDDGSILCILRTTDGVGIGPMYATRSNDMGNTWTKPRVIAPNGVLPRLLKLQNNVLVLSSGRPGVQLRFCVDGKGAKWTEPLDIVPITDSNPHADTCGYTSILATGPDCFLIAYSHFKHVNEKGEHRKAILLREVKVEVTKKLVN